MPSSLSAPPGRGVRDRKTLASNDPVSWAQVTETQALIFSVLEHDEDDADDLLAEHACERGLEAYRLAEQLRRTRPC